VHWILPEARILPVDPEAALIKMQKVFGGTGRGDSRRTLRAASREIAVDRRVMVVLDT
jgi:hypothetical protein